MTASQSRPDPMPRPAILKATDIVRLPDPRRDVRIGVREVVRDLHGKPWLFMRVKLTGWNFPHRAELPFMLVGDVVSSFVVISPDGSVATGYFEQPLPAAMRVSFGYGRTIAWDFDLAVEPQRIERLDPARLPKDITIPWQR